MDVFVISASSISRVRRLLAVGLLCSVCQSYGLGQDGAQSAQAGTKTEAASPKDQRQKDLADDTAKLLVLANELKAELDKSSKDTLSLTVVKKAEEVEKLAHKVKEEMKKTLMN